MRETGIVLLSMGHHLKEADKRDPEMSYAETEKTSETENSNESGKSRDPRKNNMTPEPVPEANEITVIEENTRSEREPLNLRFDCEYAKTSITSPAELFQPSRSTNAQNGIKLERSFNVHVNGQ